ncbi:uncharacterized protein E0L32_011394 [Thyridium curvatum]|uniref:Phytase A n=1 Tax=Thyridium curvatum TaxID=1093900 RepID=A0A507BHP7_9PEZI|nr:uncharacterized protein E0L32_011394 [Thyridium curvatum]TPX18916.1 hypothetical protein E0L32_011394 [Thyridium curvatum]
MVSLSVGLILNLAAAFAPGGSHAASPTHTCDTPDTGFECNKSISHSWGMYSPFFSVPSEIPPGTPQGCQVTFAQVLARHGARDPTAGKTKMYSDMIEQIHAAVSDYGPAFRFIKDYEYTLGADQLTLFGQQQLVNAGIRFYDRYQHLAKDTTPFIRASGQDRVVESAQNWTQGLHRARVDDQHASPDSFPYSMVVLPEHTPFNNSLSHGHCPAFESTKDGEEAQATFLEQFGPDILVRLNEGLPGANLTLQQVIYMMDLCPFNTVADDNGKLSNFCTLFTEDDWRDYDYHASLGKWYGYGNGNPLGSSQGVGFVNELIARLTSTPVHDHTTTNSTFDEDPKNFPLGAVLYADFSHDNDITGVYAALGLYNATRPLAKSHRESASSANGYSASWTVPFAARMYVEKMTCAGSSEDLVRVLVNDRVIPLQNCEADSEGRCELGRFVDSLSFAREGGLWDRCFVE